MKTIIIAVTQACILFAAPANVYIRASAPAGFTVTSATNSRPMVITTSAAHGLNAGDVVYIGGMCANNGTTYYSKANGIRKVKATPTSASFSITDLTDADIAGNGAWCSGAAGTAPASLQFGGKLTSYPVAEGVKGGILDGDSGPLTRKFALGTHNGLTSIVVTSNVATITTSYAHGILTGDKVGIWGTAKPALNHGRDPYTVTGATPYTFTFATSGVPDGNYTANSACGSSGTDPCVRISQLAWTGNPAWDRVYGGGNSFMSGNAYKSYINGGASYGGEDAFKEALWLALIYFVDQTRSDILTALIYNIENAEQLGGVSFAIDETVNAVFATYYIGVGSQIATVYAVVRPHLTSVQKATFFEKMYNDLDTNCTKAVPLKKVLASGAAQGGGASTITLKLADAAANNYYNNNVIRFTSGGDEYWGVVSSYNASTKVATMTTPWGRPPATGVAYEIYASITRNGTTITGYNTTFTTDFTVNDGILGNNGGYVNWGQTISKVVSIESDTSMTVLNGKYVRASGTPSAMWSVPKWASGQCGFLWALKHFEGAAGGQAASYPPVGGNQASFASNNTYALWGSMMALGMTVVEDSPAALQQVAYAQTVWFDYHLKYMLNTLTGVGHSGSGYSYALLLPGMHSSAWAMRSLVPTFPSMDESGPWATGVAAVKPYIVYPDRRYIPGLNATSAFASLYGTDTSQAYVGWKYGSATTGGFFKDYGFLFAPNSDEVKYFNSWMSTNGYYTYEGTNIDVAATFLLIHDPRQASLDFTTQPTQRVFNTSSVATCVSLTGGGCVPNLRGDVFISRTGWASKTDTHLTYHSRGFLRPDHDSPVPGTLRVYKVGHLIGNDAQIPGEVAGMNGEPMLEFTGTSTIKVATMANPANARITRWRSADRGAWAAAYGDANSNTVYAMSDLSEVYSTTYNRVNRHIVHFKKPATEEIVMQFDDVDVSNSPTQIKTKVFYPQNGEAASDQIGYAEGTTTCPGTNGCSGLDTDRVILSQENGATGMNGDADRKYGVITKFFSPGTVRVIYDGTSFTGAQGHAQRVSICGGAACGTTVNGFESLIVHKIAGSLADTTLTAIALNQDANWTGVQTADKVALFSRGGALRTSVSVTTTHSGTAQYLFAGVAPGSYDVYRGSQKVRGAVVVMDGDSTIAFDDVAGVHTIMPASPSGSAKVAAGMLMTGFVAGP